jgi:glycerol-3-phosphate dehydrogenase
MAAAPATSALSRQARQESIERLARTEYDVLVIGGGVTGAGAALDAASRGLTVALVEMRDWAAGTSSRSGKLIHGGLRYLEQLNFSLVREALRERSLMLEKLCPHLVKPIQFVYPLHHRMWERAYVGAGLLLYDTLGGAAAVPRHRHLTKRAVRSLAPGIKPENLAGALTFYDAQVDDSRHTMELVRTAAASGADVCSAVKVVALTTKDGAVVGARLHDLEADKIFDVAARQVINATGVWSDKISAMAGGRPMFRVQAAKGVHILVPRTKIDSAVSMFVRAEDSVLIVRTWGRHWLIGTTDTAWNQELDHPAATSADVDYLLRNLNRVLEVTLTRADIEGVFAGLRPLVKGNTDATSKLSREHAVESPVPGFTSIVGGKYTTYRVMAKDVVDQAVKGLGRPVAPCSTENVPLLGAVGLEQARQSFSRSGAARGLTQAQIERLLGRYGSLVGDLDELMAQRPDLARPIGGAGDYLRVEPVYSATHEGALHLDDVLTRRTHIAVEAEDHGLTAAAEVASLMGPELGWDQARLAEEVAHYRARAVAELAAQQMPDDESAMKVRNEVRDLRLVVADREATRTNRSS